METEKQASLEKNQQTDSQAFPLHKNAETKDSQNGDDREMRIIIIGASKSGKSTAKDVLLGEECIKLSLDQIHFDNINSGSQTM